MKEDLEFTDPSEFIPKLKHWAFFRGVGKSLLKSLITSPHFKALA